MTFQETLWSSLSFAFSFPSGSPAAFRIHCTLFPEAYRTLYGLVSTYCPPSMPSIHHPRWTHWFDVYGMIWATASFCVYAHVIFTGCNIINSLISWSHWLGEFISLKTNFVCPAGFSPLSMFSVKIWPFCVIPKALCNSLSMYLLIPLYFYPQFP